MMRWVSAAAGLIYTVLDNRECNDMLELMTAYLLLEVGQNTFDCIYSWKMMELMICWKLEVVPNDVCTILISSYGYSSL